ncbi:hypothetical protein PG997_008530 [Apiospora hydei]|uniref:Uncharacterized protein n=1 Tax=Apiospora hydei TaxID=1337664 RepID=A0ABR1WBB8_9PEZI
MSRSGLVSVGILRLSGVVLSGGVVSVGIVLGGIVLSVGIVIGSIVLGGVILGGVVSCGIILSCGVVLSRGIVTREESLAFCLCLLEVELLGLQGQSYLHDALDTTLDGLQLRDGKSEDKLLLQERRDILDLDQAEGLELLKSLELQQQVDGLSDVQVEVGELLGVDVADAQEEHLLEDVIVQALLNVGVVEGGARAFEDLGAVDVLSDLSVGDLLSERIEGFLNLGLGVSLSFRIGGSLACGLVGGGASFRVGSGEGLMVNGSRESRVDGESQAGKDGGVDELHFDGGSGIE